jgi:hypothetical protein
MSADKLESSAVEMAQNILAAGYDKFIEGDNGKLEIATKVLPCTWPKEQLSAVGNLGRWQPYTPKIPLAPPTALTNEKLAGRDSAKTVIKLSGAPGSKERIEVLRRMQQVFEAREESPFEIDDAEMLERIVTVWGGDNVERLLRHFATIDKLAALAEEERAAALSRAQEPYQRGQSGADNPSADK